MKYFLLNIALLWGCLGMAAAQETDTAPASVDSLSALLDTLIARRLPVGSNVGVTVYDLTDNRLLYDYQGDKLSRPASTMKLLTTITALSLPRADEPFRTEVWMQGEVRQDTLHGNLYVVGGMDPEFDEAALQSLLTQVCRQPFSVVKGRICGDVSLRDSLYWGSGWLWDDNPAAYQPYLSPLMLCKGVVEVQAAPALRGEPALVEATPASTYYVLRNHTRSRVPEAGRFRLDRNWVEGGRVLTVSGQVSGRRSATVNVPHSQCFFMHTFAERLRAQGITVTDSMAYRFDTHRPDSTSVRIALHETEMQTVVNEIMKESDNLNAEAMLTRIGAQTADERPVTARHGLKAIAELMEQLGHNPDRYRLADGCGLSNYNYLSPRLLVSFLRHAYSRTDVFQKLYKALPVGGVDGTLKNRMRRGTPSYQRVHAKTGSFTAVNCLAGYVQNAGGHWLAFAIMNQNALSGRQARAFQDAVTDCLVTDGGR